MCYVLRYIYVYRYKYCGGSVACLRLKATSGIPISKLADLAAMGKSRSGQGQMQMPMFCQQMPMMPQLMAQPMPAAVPAMPREENNDTSSDEEIEQAGRARRKTFLKTILSKSFKHWGGEERPITRTIRQQFVAMTHPSLDLEVVARLSNRDFAKLTWVIYGVRPDTKLSNI